MPRSTAHAFVLASFFVACGGATTPEDPPDDGTPAASSTPTPTPSPAPAPADGGGACREGEERRPGGSSDACFSASSHVCGDIASPRVCRAGAFVCPNGTVPPGECWCFGMTRPPGDCTCAPGGWSCADDAGAD